MKLSDFPQGFFTLTRNCLVSGAAVLAALAAHATPLNDMVALDAVYIPALATTTAAAQDAASVPRAQVALVALQSQWPSLKQRLDLTWGVTSPAGWSAALAATGLHIDAAARAAAKGEWKLAHDALEPVRIDLMKVRQHEGMDYFVDRLTAFHEPMEQLAQAGSTWQPATLDRSHREELVRTYVLARALWHGIEGAGIDPTQYGLSPTRAAQLRKAIDDETLALAQLSDALRSGDNARLLKSAAAIKLPFSRAFIAFGQVPAVVGR